MNIVLSKNVLDMLSMDEPDALTSVTGPSEDEIRDTGESVGATRMCKGVVVGSNEIALGLIDPVNEL